MGRYGSCDCLCGECVPGIARPYLDIYDGPWYTYPRFHAGPAEAYSIAECIDEAIFDRAATYAQILYIHNAGSGNNWKRMAVKLYNTLTYAPSSTIKRERLVLYMDNRPTPGSFGSNVTPFGLYVYLYEGIYVRGSAKYTSSTLSNAFNDLWVRAGNINRLGGFRITDFSKLYVHVRSSFNMQTTLLGDTSTDGFTSYYPNRNISSSGPWGADPGDRSLYGVLDGDAASVLYIPQSAVAGNRCEVGFPEVFPETSRGKGHAHLLLSTNSSFGVPDNLSGEMSVLSTLYNNKTLITERTIKLYSGGSLNVGDQLTESEHKSIFNWGDLRWRVEVLSHNLTNPFSRAGFSAISFRKLWTPRLCISQVYLTRECN